jgi:hypothetical protein
MDSRLTIGLRIIALGLLMAAVGPATATELGMTGTQFTLDGKPTFLFGISYYGALGAPEEFARRDLDDIQHAGFNWIRVWATWAAFDSDLSAVQVSDGRPRQPFLDRLKWLVAECDRRGMAVDVTVGKGDGTGPARIDTSEQHRRVVTTLVTTLQQYANWYLDLSNERNIRDKRFSSFEELAQLRAEVRQNDATRLVTASHGGDIGSDDLRGYLQIAKVDFLTPHRPRDADSPGQTEETTRQLMEGMKRLGRVIPVHYQEPFRRGYGDWQPNAEDFANDARAAIASGAAGWCFHNGSEKHGPGGQPRRSFDMREKRLFDQLDVEERKAIEQLRSLMNPAKKGL